MILRPVVEIRITQNSTPTYINRNDTFELNFVSEGEINRNVSQMVQCGYIVFPKKVNIKKFNNFLETERTKYNSLFLSNLPKNLSHSFAKIRPNIKYIIVILARKKPDELVSNVRPE